MRDDERIERVAKDEDQLTRRIAAIFDAPLAWSDEHVLQALADREERREARRR